LFGQSPGEDTCVSNLLRRFCKDESGATAIEYGLIAALVAVAIIAALQLVGGSLTNTFTGVSTAINAVVGN
jgi:pilus assembly protein Flp/PilA